MSLKKEGAFVQDFMQWLYVNYILPHLEKVPQGDDALWLSSWENSLDPLQREDWEKARAFYVSHAFLLGLRTGQGLSPWLEPYRSQSSLGSTYPSI